MYVCTYVVTEQVVIVHIVLYVAGLSRFVRWFRGGTLPLMYLR